LRGPTSKGGEGREEKGGEREEKGGRGGLSGNVAEEAVCLKSASDVICYGRSKIVILVVLSTVSDILVGVAIRVHFYVW